MRTLAERLTITETYFFRHIDQFHACGDIVLPERRQSRGPFKTMRILSAGCASGEEAYTLAILLRERLLDVSSWDIKIVGLDINAGRLEKARLGSYSNWSLRETPSEMRNRYFIPDGREFRLHENVRKMVSFEERNLLNSDPLFWQEGQYDVIFCRNVTMYFTPEVMRTVIASLTRSLLPGGYLFLGHAETLRGISNDYHLRHTHGTFYYQKRGTSSEPSLTETFPWVSSRPQAEMNQCVAVPPRLEALELSTTWVDTIRAASERIAGLAETSAARFQRGNKQQPPTKAPPQWNIGLIMEYLREERFAEALALLRQLPSEAAKNPDAQLLLAVLLTNCVQLEEAEKVCRDILASDELNAGAQYLMALCKEHRHDRKAAIEHDQIAAYLDPRFAMPHLHLGLLAKRSEDPNGTRRHFEKALELLALEDAARILLFGGGFSRETLIGLCRSELNVRGNLS
jgi:chemotaxis protein methyltransferase CheR